MKKIVLASVLAFAAPTLLAAATPPIESAGDVRLVRVNCARGETVGRAIQQTDEAKRAEIHFVGTCQEDTLIERDDLTISGEGSGSILVGLMDVRASQRITLRNFKVIGVPGAPFDTNKGGINIIEGSSVTVLNVRIENIKARALQVNESTARLKDISIDKAQAGAFVFRASQLALEGSLTATNSVFGMSFLYSGAAAKSADITLNNNLFGLLVQVNGSLEHVTGHLAANNNFIGIVLAGHGALAYGSHIKVKGNTGYGIFLDEGSSLTPLIGAPEGPTLVITDNPSVGITVERGSTCELAGLGTIRRNGVGVQVDNSVLRMADTVVSGNATNLKLAFGAKAEFLGNANNVATPIECDATVLTRGSLACGPP
ncbi:MAG: right-handed parallel beta-helix repeat-containing protein [Acidobacteriota bacterium]